MKNQVKIRIGVSIEVEKFIHFGINNLLFTSTIPRYIVNTGVLAHNKSVDTYLAKPLLKLQHRNAIERHFQVRTAYSWGYGYYNIHKLFNIKDLLMILDEMAGITKMKDRHIRGIITGLKRRGVTNINKPKRG